jgi:alpha-beta hydrolase superfamily lysophospholipase
MRFSEDRIEFLNCSDGINRKIHIWEPRSPEAVFLAIHGGMAHGGDYVTPALFFKKHHIATIAPDLHGHDQKEKVFIPRFDVFLNDLELMISWIKENYASVPLFIMGHSMGSLIATHFCIRRPRQANEIEGFVLSSPYYVNAVKTPPIMMKLAGFLSALFPKMTIPIEDITLFLTHDETIANRHKLDEKDHLRASKASARFANELLKAQAYIPDHISKWDKPLFCIVAGDDHLASSSATLDLLKKIDQTHLTLLHYPENYHENFNEQNREEIFEQIWQWIKPLY